MYKKNKPQHLKAAIWSNEILGTHVNHNDNPLLFYVQSLCEEELKPKERHDAICINEENLTLIDKNSDKFKINYDVFFKKQVLDQIDEFKWIPSVKQVLADYEKETNSSI